VQAGVAPALLALTLAAFALRLFLLDRFPLREDEAIYAFWARSVARDPWFLSVWPDKPPLFLWLEAAALALLGPSAAAARWLSIAASTLTVPLAAAAARRLWGPRAALASGALLALNPFAVAFAPTGYTDALLVACGMAAVALAVRGRAFGAGFWLGAAAMTKQQGLLYVPLVLGLLLVARARPGLGRALARFALGAALTAVPILLWDAARWAVAPSPWDLGARNYAALALAPPREWPARAAAWAPLLWELAGSWLAWALLALVAAWATVRARTRTVVGESRDDRHTVGRDSIPAVKVTGAGGHGNPPSVAAGEFQHDRAVGVETRSAAQAGWLIAAWSAAFIALHLATTLQPWDRYLLPLAPALALLGGWAISALPPFPARRAALAALVALALLLPPAWAAAQGRTPVGGDHGDLAGLDAAFAAVSAATQAAGEGSARAVLYHRVTGWQARFYLYDAVQAGAVDLRWFPGAPYLADNAAKTPHLRRFLVEPDWGATRDLALHLRTRGLAPVTLARSGRFTLYELVGAPQAYCAWCVSRPARVLWPIVESAAESCR
jgi:4-amino-4-deoxy-L-arabinose transferase-like glycosyltransferase